MEKKISDRIRYVGVNDHTKVIFEGMWPLPFGVSYNSYLVVDEKVALIDTVEAGFEKEYLGNIRNEIGDRKIDYLVVNHMEPDHSSLIATIREHYPDIRILTSAKAVPMIKGYFGLTDNIHAVKEGESISLGESSLTFYMAPMVHWPETMVTYLGEEKTLFSGDAFGCFGTLDGGIVDYQMNTEKYWDEMFRYYSNIVGKYGTQVQMLLKKAAALDIKLICPLHGFIWTKYIPYIVEKYNKWSSYDACEKAVMIVYGSVYGHTENAAQIVASKRVDKGVNNVVLYDVSMTHLS